MGVRIEIAWLGHSSVRIRSNGVTLITDPYDDSLGLSMGPQRADIVTTSHPHVHHSHTEGIEGDARVLRGPGDYEIAHFYITGIGTDRNLREEASMINTVFRIHCEGVRLCHLGDLNRELSPRQIEELGQTDVLFVPAGGVCTLSTPRVAELVGLIQPRIVVPLHYRIEGVKVDIQSLDGFLEDMGMAAPAAEARLAVTASNLPLDMRLAVLQLAS